MASRPARKPISLSPSGAKAIRPAAPVRWRPMASTASAVSGTELASCGAPEFPAPLAAVRGSSLPLALDKLAPRSIVKRKLGTGDRDREIQIGGVIYPDSADKGARFVQLCNQKGIPLIFLQDVTGFMVGSRAERRGIIKSSPRLMPIFP